MRWPSGGVDWLCKRELETEETVHVSRESSYRVILLDGALYGMGMVNNGILGVLVLPMSDEVRKCNPSTRQHVNTEPVRSV